MALLVPTVQAASPLPAQGLIVQLKDASSSHAAIGQAMAQRQSEKPMAGGLSAADQQRWQRVLKDTGMSDIAVQLGGAHMRPVGGTAQLVDFKRPLSAEEAEMLASRLKRHADVAWVVPNEREHRQQSVIPNDPLYPQTHSSTGQWWLHPAGGSNANALKDRLRGVPGFQTAWAVTTGGPGAVVAVLDTGVTSHPELNANLLPGYDFVSEVEYANDGNGRDNDPSDPGDWVSASDRTNMPALFGSCRVENSSWHGTSIAGMIAAVTDNGIGVAGANWNGRILPVRVAGKCGATVADIVDGMRWAAGLPVSGVPNNPNPARVVNISFGSSAACNAAYQSAIDELRALGVVVVAAGGNQHSTVIRPASCNGVVAVGSLNRDGFKTTYSSFGPKITVSTVGGDDASGEWGDLLADGGLLTIDNSGTQSPGSPTYARQVGTSFSTPVAAGVVSLMLSANPTLTVQQIIDGLQRSARPHVTSSKIGQCSVSNPGRCICTTSTCGAGILDAAQALQYALNPDHYIPPALSPANIDALDVDAAVARGVDVQVAGSPSSDDGGGGAADWWSLVGLVSLVVAAAAVRRRRR